MRFLKKELFKLDNIFECVVSKRINRFVVEVSISKSRLERAHINNTGRLYDLLVKGKIGYCILRDNPGKTRYRLFAIKHNLNGILIDTLMQMKSFEKSLEKNFIPWLKDCVIVKRNVKLYSSNIDYLIKCKEYNVYLEAKSATLSDNKNKYIAMYPDCPSIRGRKHIYDLIKLVERNGRGIILFISGLPSVKYFKPYKDGDPVIFNLFKKAKKKGVLLKGISVYFDPRENKIFLGNNNLKILI